MEKSWSDIGLVDSLKDPPLREITVQGKPVALSYKDGQFGAILGVCTHVGGPLGKGKLEGDYIVCPWHYWQFHRTTGSAQPGYEDKVSQYELKIENNHLFINTVPITKGHKSVHPPHLLARDVKREEGPIRVVGISTTIMDSKNPRYSTSDKLLEVAINHAKNELGAQTMFIRLNDLKFRACEGFYSKSAFACTWPCSITQMDETDQLTQVYEALIHWADVVIVATPIRWGAASSLYHKMIERMNCVQNQITINNKVLIQNKVASFIITGGQDNVQDVAGHMLGFFSEIGFVFPPFPFIAHTRGWDAEDMENNIAYVAESDDLKNGAKDLVRRSIDMAKIVLQQHLSQEEIVKAGRKAQHLTINEEL
ncbi:MAG: (2Fe-2S)-binding protein [Candidatus Nitrosocosmicus sp.]|uniref:Rieske (2Fe-2S) domain protein n=1 Tax=Nitrosarchaeum koreense MY1 TaxID=1001994 RepID=F9CZ73_9ARCH|nr:Rieske 2Fe-2S domain-containing protein [Nitrosarchaeum koreense]EGP94231.1 Rieske (2Fe-2S) domain protein [Nitrosarchaeum koreense MY1]NOJ32712.1 (2Fe-2S)-binding protein [Candidatus Nitrosocosmicus sp.]HSA76790.1 Rieske 2Fe-2S domain-containing protein [Nitrosarchaeum sp.]